LKPDVPALAQQMVSPLVSVIVITVLLNVALMWTTPTVTLRRTFFRVVEVGVVVLATALELPPGKRMSA
jgi:hypothetical protein